MNEITKLHKRDTTSSYDEFLRYAQSYKLILTPSTTHPVINEAPSLYFEGATLSNFIHKGRPTTTKLTLVDLPSSIDHSTFRECSKGILCLPPTFHHSPLTRPVVIISYSLHLGRKNTLPSTSTIRWKTERESTPKRLIYSTSKSGTTFQVGIQSSNSLIKSTQKVTCTGFYVYIEIIYIDSLPDPDIFAPFAYYEPSDEFIRNLYNDINDTNYISNH